MIIEKIETSLSAGAALKEDDYMQVFDKEDGDSLKIFKIKLLTINADMSRGTILFDSPENTIEEVMSVFERWKSEKQWIEVVVKSTVSPYYQILFLTEEGNIMITAAHFHHIK